MAEEKTVYQVFKEIEAQERRQTEACVESIIQGRSQDSSLRISQSILKNRHRLLPAYQAIAKYSRGGRFLGWYREGQQDGIANRLSPVAQDADSQYQAYKKSCITAIPKSITGAILGAKSGQARKDKGLAPQILQCFHQLIVAGVPRSHRRKRIASKLGCSVEYVNRVLRQNPLKF